MPWPLPLPIAKALTNAKAMLGTLAQQHADLEQRRRANLAFSGQTLVGDNLDVLQDAVESVIAAFLLPARVGDGLVAGGSSGGCVAGWMRWLRKSSCCAVQCGAVRI